jgi:hypothetical protein
MKLFRLIPIYTAAAALILTPALSVAQTDQVTGAVTKAETKARNKAKKIEKQATETTGQPGTLTGTGAPQTTQAPGNITNKTAPTGSAQRAVPTVSDSEIAAAKASGKVWVNTQTGVYHKGGKWYGATKQGKFMTEDDAIKAGYRASKTK